MQAGASSEITVSADRVFSATPQLSGEAIVDFVQSLCDVSWEEIQSSGMSENPRLFSLQKVVEISYYNMGRIRMEWSRLWTILGEHFNHVCCHPNLPLMPLVSTHFGSWRVSSSKKRSSSTLRSKRTS